MKLIIVASCLMVFAGCASKTDFESTSLSNGDVVYTVRCDENLGACHNDARRICGAGGFEEVDRFSSADLGNDGWFDDQKNALSQGTGIYKEDVRSKVREQGLTIRCNNQSPQ